MNIDIQELRFSLSQMQVFSTFVPNSANYAFLGQQINYRNQFDKLRSEVAERIRKMAPGEQMRLKPGELTIPWFKRHHFWENYLGQRKLDGVSGEVAWAFRVPFRIASPAKVLAVSPPLVHVAVEGYLYLHGVAVVLRATLSQPLPLYDMVDAAFDVMNQTEFKQIRWSNGTMSPHPLTFKGLAVKTLDYLTNLVINSPDDLESRLCEPFTVATIIRGGGLDLERLRNRFQQQIQLLDDPLAAQIAILEPKIHHACEGLASWNPAWRTNVAHPACETALDFKGQTTQPGYMLYGLKRGRVVWFPGYFMSTKPLHRLGCYHSNLTVGSLQTDSLLELVRLAEGWLANHSAFRASDKDIVKRGVILLSNLYGGANTSYRSWSLRQQIKDSGLLGLINRLRAILSIGDDNNPLLP
jgi:hypothetical protein